MLELHWKLDFGKRLRLHRSKRTLLSRWADMANEVAKLLPNRAPNTDSAVAPDTRCVRSLGWCNRNPTPFCSFLFITPPSRAAEEVGYAPQCDCRQPASRRASHLVQAEVRPRIKLGDSPLLAPDTAAP